MRSFLSSVVLAAVVTAPWVLAIELVTAWLDFRLRAGDLAIAGAAIFAVSLLIGSMLHLSDD
jgi:hypothetical protein